MLNAKGLKGTIFHDPTIEPFGTKLIGNYRFMLSDDEPSGVGSQGYVSPGHSSAMYDQNLNKYFIFFHMRFAGLGEKHQVRVHQMFFNDEGWPVITPYRYSGEELGLYSHESIAGRWEVIDHGRDISAQIKKSVEIVLNDDGTIEGSREGTWNLINGNKAELVLDGIPYKGLFLHQWDTNNNLVTMTFSVVSQEKGNALWGSKAAESISR